MKVFSVASTSLFSMLAFAGSGSNQPATRVWITDVIIVSPENLEHIGKGSLLIEDGRIAKVEHCDPGQDAGGSNRGLRTRTIPDSWIDRLASPPGRRAGNVV
ncbi:MAG TPA: hypothetical protein VIX37_15760 [Candidatus Sulfotelmatobacter sp.]